MEEWGNGAANEFYEANVPRDYIRPKENDSVRVVERFIRDKYEHKKFISKGNKPEKREEIIAPVQVQEKPNTSTKRATTKSKVTATVQPVVAPVQQLDLLDLSEPIPVVAAPIVAQQPPPQQQQQAAASFNNFIDFGTPSLFPGASVPQAQFNQPQVD